MCNLLDLFSGIGGFRLGLEMAGFQFGKTYHSDIEEYPNKIYAQHWPDSVSLGDITKVDPTELGDIDIVTGGFPCQDISVAGNQKGLEDEEGRTRSGLFYEIIRLCGVLRPRIILLENVANLLVHDGGRTFGTVLSELAKIGYDAEWEVISAKDVGAPHLRKRVWIICYPNSSRESISAFNDEARLLSENVADSKRIRSQGQREYERPLNKKKNKNREADRLVNSCERKEGPWHIEPDVGRVVDGVPDRMDRIKGLGNAVVPQVVELIGRKILESGML